MQMVVYDVDNDIEKIKLLMLEYELFVSDWSAEKIFSNQWNNTVHKLAVAYNSEGMPVAWAMHLSCPYFLGKCVWAYTTPKYRQRGIGKRLVGLVGGIKGRNVDRGLPYQEYFWSKCEKQLQEAGMMVS